MDKKGYKVKAKYTFNGTFFVKANTREEARMLVEKHCGLVLGGHIHSTLPEEEVDWDFEVHPIVKVF